ncbi:MAG: sugar transferase, partial [Devosia sp.]
AALVLLSATAGTWALQPPPDQPFTTAVFRPDLSAAEIEGRLAALGARVVWAEPDLAVAILDLPPGEGGPVRQVIVADGQGDNPVFSKTKRFVDLGFALSIIILLWWAMLIIWAAIRLQSPGPGIFRQERVGRNEQVFTCLKFRTMYISAPNVGTHEVPAASVTPLGHFLRRTKLDELPQVINILRNDMSLVGPRPCLPNQASMIAERRAQGVFEIKPGITGLAQVRGIDMSDPAGLAACDREYLLLQSLLLDVKIILQTARGAGSGDNVATVPPGADGPR